MCYTEEELKAIQRIELEALKCIVSICDRLNIEYFLIGGTALGAVRHNGFIPWDDDIDIGLTRENYIRFLKEIPKQLPPIYQLQTPYDNPQCPYFYSKIRINGTLFIEYCNRNIKMHHGVYVDIFPFDNVPDDEDLNIHQYKKIQRLIRIFSLRQIPDVSSQPAHFFDRLMALIRQSVHYVFKLIPYNWLIRLLDEEFTRYNNQPTKALSCLNFPCRKTEYVLKEELYPLVKHKFEDADFLIPRNYDKYLKNHYGDYNELPPEDMRYGHKPFRISLG